MIRTYNSAALLVGESAALVQGSLLLDCNLSQPQLRVRNLALPIAVAQTRQLLPARPHDCDGTETPA